MAESPRITFRVPEHVYAAATEHANRRKITVGRLCQEALAGALGVESEPLATGLAGADEQTRARVAAAGGTAKGAAKKNQK